MKSRKIIVLPALLMITIIILVFYYQANQLNSERTATSVVELAPQNETILTPQRQQGTVELGEESQVLASRQSAFQETASESSASAGTGQVEEFSQTTGSPPATTRSLSQPKDTPASTLSERVFNVIDQAQWLQQSGQWEESLVGLNALYSDFESMNTFEQSTLLNFYTNTLIRMEMWQESISAFTLMLTIPDLRPDINARALMALGQLHERVDEADLATGYYEEWLEYTRGMPGMEQQTARVEQQLNGLR